MIKYFIPFYYTLHSRAHGIHFVSYFLMNILPPFLLLILYQKLELGFSLVLKYVLSFLAMLSLYESGYLVNDSINIQIDSNPTRRISYDEEDFIRKHIRHILVFKTLCAVLCFVPVCLLSSEWQNCVRLAICLIFILIIFAVHNKHRSWINYLTIFLLTTLNYASPIAAFGTLRQFMSAVLIIMLIFSLAKTVFYIIRKKQTNYKEGPYYSLYMLAAAAILCKQPIWIIPFYIGLYRLLNFLRSMLWKTK